MSPDRHRQKAIQAVLDAVSRTPAMGMQELSFDPFTGYLLKRATKGEPVLKAGTLCHSSDLSSPVPNSALYSGDIWLSLVAWTDTETLLPGVSSPKGQQSWMTECIWTQVAQT